MTLHSTAAPKCDINVTPMIDVLLVLLIIFMVITPLSSHRLSAMLPPIATANHMPAEQPIILEVTADRRLLLGGRELTFDRLTAEIASRFSSCADKSLFIKADPSIDYRTVAETLDSIRGSAPYLQLGFLPRSSKAAA